MLRRSLFVGLAFVLVASVSLFAGGQSEAGSEMEGPIELTIGHIQPTGHTQHQALEVFKEEVESDTDGAVVVTIIPGGQLGSERAIVEGVKIGTVDMSMSGGAGWSTIAPAAAVFELPFLYESTDSQANYFIESGGMDLASEVMVPMGIRPVGVFVSAPRNAILVDDPIYTLADLQGVKIRVPESQLYINTWRSLGANPTPVPWGEAYSALASGLVDGAEVNAETIVNAQLHEVVNYMSETAHSMPPLFLGMSEKKWQSIPAEYQSVILEAGKTMSRHYAEVVTQADMAARQTMRDAGVEFNELASGERAKFIAAVDPVYEQYRDEFDVGNVIDALLAAQ
jgi:tripartite ATP-independent transporter DctP family solute receptor